MSSLVISGDTSGTVTLAAPAVAGSNTLTLQAGTATNSMNTLSTAVASTSGTSIDFTSIPSWVKRITVMFNGISTNGTSNYQVQIGSSSVTTTGYATTASRQLDGAANNVANFTTGFNIAIAITAATNIFSGELSLVLLSSNTWVAKSVVGATNALQMNFSSGSITLGGALDRVRITTVNGTDTFDAGTVNILYEG